MRLALYLGMELIFVPPGEAKRNHVVERVHGTWAESFWNKNHFTSLCDLERKSPKFFDWYENYAPPDSGGLTVKQAAHQLRSSSTRLRRQRRPNSKWLSSAEQCSIKKTRAAANWDEETMRGPAMAIIRKQIINEILQEQSGLKRNVKLR